MNQSFYKENRKRLYERMKEHSLMVLFSGASIRKSGDEDYNFYTDRNFLYLTGLNSKNFVLLVCKDDMGKVTEKVYILEPDYYIERRCDIRLKADEVTKLSGINEIEYIKMFENDLDKMVKSGYYANIYLDLREVEKGVIDNKPSGDFSKFIRKQYPYIYIENANILIRRLRTIKQPCEVAAIKEAEKITKAGILAMMRTSTPGMHEYQYKAEFDYALGQFGPQGPAFPSIISAGRNNFCIHYYAYNGRANDGDIVLNDVGAWHDGLMTDVSRAFPCNGRFTDRQKLLFNCALNTSNYMFEIIKPGMKMADVDQIIRTYNCEQLKMAGVLESYEEIDKYMWHGGAHHVGWDVHDEIEMPEIIASDMVFCVDVGIYHEEWGIGFRLEDNCLVTKDGCENLSESIPRTVEDIEAVMGR